MEAVTGIHDVIRNQFRYFFCVELLHCRIAPACTPYKMCTTIIAKLQLTRHHSTAFTCKCRRKTVYFSGVCVEQGWFGPG
jgi:hypothetical protein